MQFVRVGSVNRGSGGTTRRVTRVINHPQYAGGANDIALLELAMPITHIKPVPIAPAAAAYLYNGVGNMGINDRGVNVGFGGINASGTLPAKLQWRNVDNVYPTNDSVPGLQAHQHHPGPVPGRQRRAAARDLPEPVHGGRRDEGRRLRQRRLVQRGRRRPEP